MLTRHIRKYWPLYVAALIYFGILDILFSLLNTCHPQYDQAANDYNKADSCKFLQGPIITRFVWFAGLFDANAVIAVFTGVLAISTIALWDATNRSAKIAHDTLTKLERAFISFRVKGRPRVDFNNRLEGWQIVSEMRNSGKTQVVGLYANVSWDAPLNELPDDFTFPDITPGPATPKGGIIGPDDSAFQRPVYMPNAFLEAARQGHIHLYIWGWAEYDDIFEGTPPHRTEFAFEILVDSDPYISRTPPFIFNGITAYSGADEDCYRQARPRELRRFPLV